MKAPIAPKIENDNAEYWLATLRKTPQTIEPRSRLNALVGRVSSLVDQYVRQSTELANPETLTAALRNEDPARLCDIIASNLKISHEDKQGLLEILSLQDRLMGLIEVLEIELERIQVDRAIHGRVKRQMEHASPARNLFTQVFPSGRCTLWVIRAVVPTE